MKQQIEQPQAEILLADPEFVVCCKAPGVECQQQLPALLSQMLGGDERDFFCVHRLDRGVGGVMVYARTAAAAAVLSEQIQKREFEKQYLAVAGGIPEPACGRMEDLLLKDSVRSMSYPVKRMRKGVKQAALSYRTKMVAQIDGQPAALVQVLLETGRFHQIRAQFAARKMPLLGDGKYGSREKRCSVALWSNAVGFRHPKSGKRLCISAAPPRVFPWDCFAAEKMASDVQTGAENQENTGK